MISTILRFIRKDDGATAIEYGLIAALLAVGIVVAVTALGTDLTAVFDNIVTKLAPGKV